METNLDMKSYNCAVICCMEALLRQMSRVFYIIYTVIPDCCFRNVVSAPPRRSKTPRNTVANNNQQNNTNKENNLKSGKCFSLNYPCDSVKVLFLKDFII